jgi:hypothetical protein
MAMMGGTLPQVSAGGEISMTLHQVNGDGAGPYTCQIDSAGDGSAFVDMQVTTQVAGKNSRSNAKAVDLPLKAAIPAGQTCAGNVAGQANVCMVRCMNAARAGPFGGCVPVQMANAAAGNNTAATKRVSYQSFDFLIYCFANKPSRLPLRMMRMRNRFMMEWFVETHIWWRLEESGKDCNCTNS